MSSNIEDNSNAPRLGYKSRRKVWVRNLPTMLSSFVMLVLYFTVKSPGLYATIFTGTALMIGILSFEAWSNERRAVRHKRETSPNIYTVPDSQQQDWKDKNRAERASWREASRKATKARKLVVRFGLPMLIVSLYFLLLFYMRLRGYPV